jgi:transmembrane sensor
MDPIPTDRTLAEAARWHARLHAPDCSAEERAQFEAWRAAESSHNTAYARAKQAASAVTQLLYTDPRLQALLDDALLSRAAPTTTPTAAAETSTSNTAVPSRKPAACINSPVRRWAIPASLVASLALCVFSLRFVGDGTRAADPTRTYATSSAQRTVVLADGSTAQLDVGTRLSVRMTPQRRFITLESGRAVFDVAHDASRPFSVTAATSRTTALGTKFQVQLQERQVVVTLEEGSVAVDNEDSTQVWQEQLRPGEQLKIDVASANRDKLRVDPSVTTSWTRGRLLFRDTRLEDAIAEVNRYSEKKIRLGDPSLGDMYVGGNFIAGESTIIVDAFAAVLPLRVVDGGDKEIILFRRYETAPH